MNNPGQTAAKSFPFLNFQHYLPASHLRPWVQCFWSIGTAKGPDYSGAEKLYPDAGTSLIINLAPADPVIAFVQNTCTIIRRFNTRDRLLSIRFKPAGAFFLLGLHPERDQEELILGEALRPPWYDGLLRLVERLAATDGRGHFALLHAWLDEQLARQQPGDLRTLQLVDELGQTSLNPRQVGEQLGLSRRTLERKLKRELGVSPGQLQTYRRMGLARRLLSRSDRALSEIALECGYYDQAHFSHAFRSFTFETPAGYRRRKLSQFYKAG